MLHHNFLFLLFVCILLNVTRRHFLSKTKDWRLCCGKFDFCLFCYRGCQFVSVAVLVCITIVLFVDAMLLQSSFLFVISFAIVCSCVCPIVLTCV